MQEKLLSFSGEDFRVRDTSNAVVMEIDGKNVNIGGYVLDKLFFKDCESGEVAFSVERRAIAASTCYDVCMCVCVCVYARSAYARMRVCTYVCTRVHVSVFVCTLTSVVGLCLRAKRARVRVFGPNRNPNSNPKGV